MATNSPIGEQLLDVPFPDMVKSMGLAIAQAQLEMDMVGIRLAQMMSGEYEVEDPDAPGEIIHQSYKVQFGGQELSLLELGFTPTFYHFVDTIIEVKISISMASESSSNFRSSTVEAAGGGTFFGFYNSAHLRVTAVSASYASKYQYSAEGSSLLRTKLVPVPPPAVLQERIRKLLTATSPP